MLTGARPASIALISGRPRHVLGAIEAKFGVDRHILVAIWGIESFYGSMLNDLAVIKPVVRSLATLACGMHRARASGATNSSQRYSSSRKGMRRQIG